MASTAWHCFFWKGQPLLIKDAERRDSSVAVPPLRSKYWLEKPTSMLVKSTVNIDDAVTWVGANFQEHSQNFYLPAQNATRLEEKLAWSRHHLSHEKILVWCHWLTDRATQVEWVVVPNDSVDLRLP